MKCTKVAIISDIHANIQALYAFIQYIEREKIEVVLNLGDFISSGPNPCEVFDLLMEDKRFINIRGYDEESIFNHTKMDQGIGEGRWLRETLGKQRLEKLRDIPSVKSIEINKKKVFLCHHNGWADIEQLVAHTKQLKYDKYEFFMCGGTHIQEFSHSRRHYPNTNIIDPGTLGAGKDNKAFFASINFRGNDPVIKFHSIKVDKKEKYIVNKLNEIKDTQENKEINEEDVIKDTFLYIQGAKQTKDGVMSINDEVVNRIIEIGIRQCKYISIGCWRNERQLIRELLYHLKCRKIKRAEKENQQWYIGEITEDVIKLLIEKRNLPDGTLKWFEISFQNQAEDSSPIYSIFNYGKKGYLKRLSQKQIYSMEELLKKYNLAYTLPEEKSE